jgi:UDP-N-acetylmuramate--alanine ligase
MTHVHFVGVSGIGMSALCSILLQEGLKVSGSADVENELTEKLVKEGLVFHVGHSKRNIDNPDTVIKSAAVPEKNPEILYARKRKIPVYLYAEYLGRLMSKKTGIAVAGTHGKTTTTAITAMVLHHAGLKPTVVCGGLMQNFSSNALYGKGKYFVSEACEYKRSFLRLQKRFAIITNVEPDHLDYYRDIDDIKHAFRDFLSSVDNDGLSVVNGDDENLREIISTVDKDRIITVGFSEGCSYKIRHPVSEKALYSFDIDRAGRIILRLRLSVPGVYNCMNAALPAVLAWELAIEKNLIEEAVYGFKGLKRRLEYLGKIKGNDIYSDYAHHPTEVAVTFQTLKEMYPGEEICVIFQPHQFSRTLSLFHDFVSELVKIDRVILMDIYRQRDTNADAQAVHSGDLFKEIRKTGQNNVDYVGSKEELELRLKKLDRKNTVIVFMGAGDIDGTAKWYVNRRLNG